MTVRRYFSEAWRGGAGFLSVLYHATVRDIRSAHANAFIAIGSEIAQALVLVILIMVFLNALGIGRLMVRGNAMLSVLTGVFLFLVHTRAFSRVIASAAKAGKMVRHRSTPPVLLHLSAALASLYIQTLALLVMLLATHVLFAPVEVDAAPRAALAVGLAWFSVSGLASSRCRCGPTPRSWFRSRAVSMPAATCSSAARWYWPADCLHLFCNISCGTRCFTSSIRRAPLYLSITPPQRRTCSIRLRSGRSACCWA